MPRSARRRASDPSFTEPETFTGAKTKRTVPVDNVIPNPRNDNVHPQPQIDMLAKSYERFGQPKPILVRQANRMIIAGEGIWTAMRQAGAAQIEVILWDVDQRTADAFLLADNQLASRSHRDQDRTRALLAEFGEEEYASMGFIAAEVEKLLEGADAIMVHEIETGPVGDTFWLSVRGPLEQQAYALQRLQELMSDLPGVEVDLGTVNHA